MASYGNFEDILEFERVIELEFSDIKAVFQVFLAFHRIRRLITIAALNAAFAECVDYDDQEDEVKGFAKEMLNQLRIHLWKQAGQFANHHEPIEMHSL
jgi:hypothetical protein